MSETPERKTDKGNTYIHEVWVTHRDTTWGPHLESVSEKPWDEDYDAPITKYADQTRFINADRIEELEAKLAKAVKGIRTARGFYQVTHIHAALDATLAELTGGKDE